ncbi:AAA family ATPase [Trichocoleus desertorum GB2-A4]|uniref:AAA family ATPase n=1 Tax=Trichocoleus desertorum GB2-A4 TaxID=2933944 RepID=A0ABV0JAQ0_9CYAN
MPPIYFLALGVENVLCFKDLQILYLSDENSHPAQWTVILGDNGVGKTTLLRCLAGLEVKTDQHTEEFGYFPLLLTPYSFEGPAMWQEVKILERNRARVYPRFVSNITLTSLKESKKADFQEHEADVGIASDCSFMGQEFQALICYGYGATRRMGETSLGESLTIENSVSLFSERASLINAEEWLLQTDYAARSASGEIRARLEKQLHQIIEVLKRILPDIEDIRIAPADEEIPRPRAEFLTPYGWVHLSSLGLGYRTAVAWMVDLAVRLFRRYPDSEDPLAEPAIVLVDEIDLHLHPKWQRNIMNFLTERFPNTQFIVTAHSPLVVQAAKDANIVLLRREGDRVVIDNNPEIVENWRVDQVLTSVFELPTARPADLEPLLARRQELLSKARLSKADKAELQELEAQIGALPTAETPEDIKAMDIIRRAAKLLENS